MSTRKEDASERRDFRNGGAAKQHWSNGNARKDTVKWCRGKVGKHHAWVRQQPTHGMFYNTEHVTVMQCSACGKIDTSTILFDNVPFHEYFRRKYGEEHA